MGSRTGVTSFVLIFLSLSTLDGAQVPTRIVSTSPSITETLFALGLGDRVVAVSRYCRYPEEVVRLPKVGTFLQPEAELIARLTPDLVIIHPSPNGIDRRLSALRLPFLSVDHGTLASVYSSIRAIGTATGIPDRAEALVTTLKTRLQRTSDSVAGRPRQRVLIIVGRRSGTLTDLIAVGPSSYLNDLLKIAGGVNVLDGDRLPEYPRISMETVIRLAPDVIIDSADMGETPEERRARQNATEGLWRRQQQISAVRANRVHSAVDDAFVLAGPRVVEVAETFARWLHGVRP